MLLNHDQHRIQHMLEAARQAMSFIEGRQRSHLNADAQLRLALLRALEVIGEAANKVTPDTRAAHPEIPWSKSLAFATVSSMHTSRLTSTSYGKPPRNRSLN